MSLSSLRNQIDELDSQILELFLKRINVCREIAKLKKKEILVKPLKINE